MLGLIAIPLSQSNLAFLENAAQGILGLAGKLTCVARGFPISIPCRGIISVHEKCIRLLRDLYHSHVKMASPLCSASLIQLFFGQKKMGQFLFSFLFCSGYLCRRFPLAPLRSNLHCRLLASCPLRLGGGYRVLIRGFIDLYWVF